MLTFVQRKIAYSTAVVAAYVAGRNIPIPWAVSSGVHRPVGLAESLASSMLGRAEDSASILSLGFGPWMMAMILVMIAWSFFSKEYRQKSARLMQRWIMILTLIIAVGEAALRAHRLDYSSAAGMTQRTMAFLTAILLVAGSFVCMWLADRNERKGIGGKSLLILVNILESLRTTAMPCLLKIAGGLHHLNGRLQAYIAAALFSLLLILMVLLLQRAEIHLPINRVMIHNVYADKDYLAISMLPAGTMPAMFALTFFMLPVYALRFFSLLMPGRAEAFRDIALWFSLGTPHGVVLYLAIMVGLTVVFAHINIDPQDIADGLMKSGDCIPGIRPGEETAEHIERRIAAGILISVIAMGIGIGLPLAVGILWRLPQEITMLPTTILILASLVVTIMDEYETLRTFEYYRPFL
ncbi:accessory Sec system translocase SecY2 [Lachnospiraceae bacterium NK3A20]|nr:accessory Sec system translocase SecY2 [Lachnospiraceae bacterium NK3A20]